MALVAAHRREVPVVAPAGVPVGEVEEDSMAEGVAEATMLSRPDAADHRNMEE